MKIINEQKNALLNRTEISASFEEKSVPSLASVAKLIADHFKIKEEAVAIKKVDGGFGKGTFLAEAFVYNSLADKLRVEPRKKEKKKEGAS